MVAAGESLYENEFSVVPPLFFAVIDDGESIES
jgi:hypothetical protein